MAFSLSFDVSLKMITSCFARDNIVHAFGSRCGVGVEAFPYVGHIGMCGPKKYGTFFGRLRQKLVYNRGWFCTLVLNWVTFYIGYRIFGQLRA